VLLCVNRGSLLASCKIRTVAYAVQNTTHSGLTQRFNKDCVLTIILYPAGSDKITEAHQRELDRILQISFNPLSSTMLTDMDKVRQLLFGLQIRVLRCFPACLCCLCVSKPIDTHRVALGPVSIKLTASLSYLQAFLWDLRYSLLNRAELLPAFVMSVRWNSSEQVQELYDLLDLWAPPTCVQALQLLDRRFMDPKVRAYAVHCLEDLPDDELALYMLQLCQQLKFER
jgi:hypothetical protein